LKILLLKPSSLGDVVQALPVLRLLRRHFPQARIYWWIESGLAPLLEDDPDLTGIVRFERNRWASPVNWGELWHSLQWVRQQHFDWVIDLQCLARSATFAWLANGKLTIGLDEPREFARGFYDLIARRSSFHTHAVDWYLEVLRLLHVPVDFDFEWLPPQAKAAAEIQAAFPLNGSKWIIVQPGARWTNKRWPAERYAQVVRELAKAEPKAKFAVLGGKQETDLAQTIAQANPAIVNLAGRTTLPQMVEWIRRSDLMVTNDTGPMHIAAALHKPVVAILGPTEPRRTGPFGQLGNVLQAKGLDCVPCLKPKCKNRTPLACLYEVSPQQVTEKAIALLRQA